MKLLLSRDCVIAGQHQAGGSIVDVADDLGQYLIRIGRGVVAPAATAVLSKPKQSRKVKADGTD